MAASTTCSAAAPTPRSRLVPLIDALQQLTLNLLGHMLSLSCLFPALALALLPRGWEQTKLLGAITQLQWDAHDWLEEMELHRLSRSFVGPTPETTQPKQQADGLASDATATAGVRSGTAGAEEARAPGRRTTPVVGAAPAALRYHAEPLHPVELPERMQHPPSLVAAAA